ncbi:MAG TPA: hypothetical protein VGN72_14285 [Tepidisphaeraceae bacterium]|jgi:hypothetical protein|nr:hypothetical protein [Tepidisphaeraceae bacterium]
MDPFIILLLVFAFLAAAFCFTLWATVWVVKLAINFVAMILRGVWQLGVASTPPSPQFGPPVVRPMRVLTRRCANRQCGTALPSAARFCTRCGSSTSGSFRQVA